jgi:hypothetical protein
MEPKHPLSARVHVIGLVLLIAFVASDTALAQNQPFIKSFSTVTIISPTVPANGDINPYGVAQVPETKGKLIQGRFLISNFNNGANQQGTGTTIVQIAPNGTFSLFAQIDPTKVSCTGGIGLTTALVALQSGFVIVGSLPTTDGTAATAGAGCLIVLNSMGNVVDTISGHHLNGPWDMTALDSGSLAALFVTNVLNGTVAANGGVVNGGTVVRLTLSIPNGQSPQLVDSTVIASGFPERTDPAALVIGPTGVAFDNNTGTLFVADSLSNRIAAVPNALFRKDAATDAAQTIQTVSQGHQLNDPLGLVLAPNGDLIAANGNDGNLVEVAPLTGMQAAKRVDNSGSPPKGAGALFGLFAVSDGVYFVDDAANTFNFFH